MEELVVSHPVDRRLLLVEILQETGLGLMLAYGDQIVNFFNSLECLLQQQEGIKEVGVVGGKGRQGEGERGKIKRHVFLLAKDRWR